jgi:hypothetical protein
MRIIKTLLMKHPDYSLAKSSLKSIFAKLKSPDAFPTIDHFRKELNEWEKTWSTPTTGSKMNKNQKIQFLGLIILKYLKMIACKIKKGRKVPNSLLKEIKKNSESIVNEKTINALNNIKSDSVAASLWHIKNVPDKKNQGTSHNEGIHSILAGAQPNKTSHQSWELTMLQLGIIFFNHNRNILANLSKSKLGHLIEQSLKGPSICSEMLVYHNFKYQPSVRFEDLKQDGFTSKGFKNKRWSKNQIKILLEALDKIYKKDVDHPQIQNLSWLIAQYEFSGQISTKEVDKMIHFLCKQYQI